MPEFSENTTFYYSTYNLCIDNEYECPEYINKLFVIKNDYISLKQYYLYIFIVILVCGIGIRYPYYESYFIVPCTNFTSF